jgi:hypothetical protein
VRQLTTNNIVHDNDRRRELLPFLIRFAQDNILEDSNNGKVRRISETIVTRVQRETTDDS